MSNGWTPQNGDRSVEVARGDYAANSGDGEKGIRFWNSEKEEFFDPNALKWIGFDYSNLAAHEWPPFDGQTGINYKVQKSS